jgi:signal transduction histidine kinase
LKLRTEIDRNDRLLIVVQDTGPGIATENINQVFKSFFTTKPGGMGLGLSICKSIVESHGGELTVMPGDPVGTVFTASLPLKRNRH